jgi:methylmalonyl-CoA mutase N-terminal domain/subunit
MFHIGIDIGGTFTDCVLIGADPDGQVTAYRTAKALATPADPADGVIAALAELAAAAGLSRPDLLGQAERFGHGTTIAASLEDVRAASADPRAGLMEPVVAALDAEATIGEITGALREGQGVSADPFVAYAGVRR